jgi:O-acetyl-ADP-ribose deacetylase (regulator of RNase III)
MIFKRRNGYMIKFINGNLLQATEDIICHQVNCRGVMGGGIAKQIKYAYPHIFQEYLKICNDYKNNTIELLGRVLISPYGNNKYVANMFSQEDFGCDKMYTDYEYLKKCLDYMCHISKEFNVSIAIPYGIGCGLGGGDWTIVLSIISESFKNSNIVIYKLD